MRRASAAASPGARGGPAGVKGGGGGDDDIMQTLTTFRDEYNNALETLRNMTKNYDTAIENYENENKGELHSEMLRKSYPKLNVIHGNLDGYLIDFDEHINNVRYFVNAKKSRIENENSKYRYSSWFKAPKDAREHFFTLNQNPYNISPDDQEFYDYHKSLYDKFKTQQFLK
jgi:hypothetical protein